MICKRCQKTIDNNAEFCNFCGKAILSAEDIQEGSVDEYFRRKNETCQICNSIGKTKYVKFYQNIGAIVVRFDKSIKGNLCKDCIAKTFWRFTLINLFLGWWGAISFFVNPFYILNNIYNYLVSFKMTNPEKL